MTCERWMIILCTSSKIVISQSIYNYGVSLKLSTMLDIPKIIIMKRHIMSEKHGQIGYWRTDTRCRELGTMINHFLLLVHLFLLFLSFLIP